MKNLLNRPAWTAALLALAAGGGLWAQAPAGGESICDPGLMGSSASATAYRQRGDRCEGLYALQVSSTQVRLASMVEVFEFDPAGGEALNVTWSRPTGDGHPVRLRAQSLRARKYYRMDTAVDAPATDYEWPSDVLASVELTGDAVGVLGWTSLGDDERRVYLPLRVSQGAAERDDAYQVAIVPDHRLLEVYLTLTPMSAQAAAGEPVFEKKPLDYGYYPSHEATVFEIGKPEKAGIYEVEIECTIMGGGSASTSFWFYHAG